MNETRVRRLAAEGHAELTKKMLRRFGKADISVAACIRMLAGSELKRENVFAYPDFNFQMGLPAKERIMDLICVQTPDGRTVRIVGSIDKRAKKQTRKRKS